MRNILFKNYIRIGWKSGRVQLKDDGWGDKDPESNSNGIGKINFKEGGIENLNCLFRWRSFLLLICRRRWGWTRIRIRHPPPSNEGDPIRARWVQILSRTNSKEFPFRSKQIGGRFKVRSSKFLVPRLDGIRKGRKRRKDRSWRGVRVPNWYFNGSGRGKAESPWKSLLRPQNSGRQRN